MIVDTLESLDGIKVYYRIVNIWKCFLELLNSATRRERTRRLNYVFKTRERDASWMLSNVIVAIEREKEREIAFLLCIYP